MTNDMILVTEQEIRDILYNLAEDLIKDNNKKWEAKIEKIKKINFIEFIGLPLDKLINIDINNKIINKINKIVEEKE